jgi:hypothetical protein
VQENTLGCLPPPPDQRILDIGNKFFRGEFDFRFKFFFKRKKKGKFKVLKIFPPFFGVKKIK